MSAYSFVDYLNDIRTVRQAVDTITSLAKDQVPVSGGQVAWDEAMKTFREASARMDRFETTPPAAGVLGPPPTSL